MFRVLQPSGGKQVAPGLCALGIMTKAPRAGNVKTRLQPPLTAEEAAALNICFLRDTAAAISSAGQRVQGVAVFTPAGSENAYYDILPADFYLLEQRGDRFGERLQNAVTDLLRAGFESCCLIDSDSPTVPAEVFAEAVELLQLNQLVLGPSIDGGYYLIGMRALERRVFEDIDWSTESVFAQTVERANEIQLPVATLPAFSDVDDAASLGMLCDELLGSDRATAPATKAFLEQLIAREGRGRIWQQR